MQAVPNERAMSSFVDSQQESKSKSKPGRATKRYDFSGGELPDSKLVVHLLRPAAGDPLRFYQEHEGVVSPQKVCGTIDSLVRLAVQLTEYKGSYTTFPSSAMRAMTNPYLKESVVATIERTITVMRSEQTRQSCSERGGSPDLVVSRSRKGGIDVVDRFLYQGVRDPTPHLLVVGDLHGSFHAMVRLLREWRTKGLVSDNLKLDPAYMLVFTGDLIDRSFYSLETLLIACKLKINNEDRVFLLNGNHEDKETWERYGFRRELANDLPRKEDVVTSLLVCFPLALFVRSGEQWIQFSHGVFDRAEQSAVKVFLNSLVGTKLRGVMTTGIGSGNGYNWSDVWTGPRTEATRGSSLAYMRKWSVVDVEAYMADLQIQCIVRGHQDCENLQLQLREPTIAPAVFYVAGYHNCTVCGVRSDPAELLSGALLAYWLVRGDVDTDLRNLAEVCQSFYNYNDSKWDAPEWLSENVDVPLLWQHVGQRMEDHLKQEVNPSDRGKIRKKEKIVSQTWCFRYTANRSTTSFRRCLQSEVPLHRNLVCMTRTLPWFCHSSYTTRVTVDS